LEKEEGRKDMPTIEQVERFHRLKQRIANLILSTIKKKEVIYGERALEVRLPHFLKRHTQDYDVYSHTPEKDAIEAEQMLDKEFGGDYFYVTPALHEGTFKVKSRINEETYADFTKPEEKIPYDVIQGKNYIQIKKIVENFRKNIKDKEKEFRHGQDRDALNRIKIYKDIKRQMSLKPKGSLLKQNSLLKFKKGKTKTKKLFKI